MIRTFKACLIHDAETKEDLEEAVAFLEHYLIGLHFQVDVALDGPCKVADLARSHLSADLQTSFRVDLASKSEMLSKLAGYDFVFLSAPRKSLKHNWEKFFTDLPPAKIVEMDWKTSSLIESRLTSFAGNLRGLEQGTEKTDGFRREIRKLRDMGKATVLVGTGPSSREAMKADMKNSMAIVCNTVIMDDHLMDYLRPKFLTFSDPAYHMGPSAYSKEFRKKLLDSAEKFPEFKILTLRKHHRPLDLLIPQLKDRIFSVESGPSRDFPLNLDLDLAQVVRPYPNILTLLMLPLAASISSELSLYGFDGRKGDDKKFWKHGESVQLNSELEELQRFHAGFHSIGYEKYFSEHSRQVGEVITAIEERNIKVRAVTPSSVPAIASRHAVLEKAPAPSSRALISFTPGWKSSFGHYESWNTALFESCQELGIEFRAISDESLHPAGRSWVLPLLSKQRSSVSRMTFVDINSSEAATEIIGIIQTMLHGLPGPISIFAYEGFLSDIEIWSKVAVALPEVRFLVNILWPGEGQSQRDWKPEYLSLPKNLVATVDSDWALSQVLQSIESVTRLPFFSPVNSVASRARNVTPAKHPLRVLWPAQPFASKGSLHFEPFIQEVANLLNERRFELTWRIPPQMKEVDKKLIHKIQSFGVRVIIDDVNLSSSEYTAFLSEFDLVVLPYPQSRRTSGLALDSIAAGTPILTLEGNWISDLGLSSAWVVQAPEAPGGLSSTLRQLLNDPSKLKANLDERLETMARFDVGKTVDFLTRPLENTPMIGTALLDAMSAFDLFRSERLTSKGTQPKMANQHLPSFDSSFSYASETKFDEGKFIHHLISNLADNESLKIVDVGAANGSFFKTFRGLYSDVWAIEPHPQRASGLRQNFIGNTSVKVIEAAISSTMTGVATLFDSKESWGVSTLKPFLDTHLPAHQVPIRRLDDLGLPKVIDILKVDVEGHDLSVLQSLDWNATEVGLVMAEYDDNKLAAGDTHSWRPLVEFLRSQGFETFISEWYPIEIYGGNHRWRKLHFDSEPYPGSWGNVIGLKAGLIQHTRLLEGVLSAARSNQDSASSNTAQGLTDLAPLGKVFSSKTASRISRFQRLLNWVNRNFPNSVPRMARSKVLVAAAKALRRLLT